jgi:hypothetical protein
MSCDIVVAPRDPTFRTSLVSDEFTLLSGASRVLRRGRFESCRGHCIASADTRPCKVRELAETHTMPNRLMYAVVGLGGPLVVPGVASCLGSH